MKKILLVFGLFVLIGAGWIFFANRTKIPQTPAGQKNTSSITVIAQNLDTPWAIAFLPDARMLVTERPGRVRLIDSKNLLDPTPVAVLSQVKEIGEGGLLGITLNPEFVQNNFVYLYYTYQGDENQTFNRVSRFSFQNKKLRSEEIIVDAIPGAPNHNGGRIKFGPDGFLYITTGDAQNPSHAQNLSFLGGKILRVSPEGKAEVYSYGHRNPQGLAWDNRGNLWSTEHGQSNRDEVNLIVQNVNYGWPIIQGDETRERMKTPAVHSGATTTWAPSGIAFVNGSLFWSGLRGHALYEGVLERNQIKTVREHFKNQFGRIREVITGPDTMLYISTSNQDGRGNPSDEDDRIIRIDPKILLP